MAVHSSLSEMEKRARKNDSRRGGRGKEHLGEPRGRAREEKKKEIPGLLKGISHLTLLRLGNGDTSLVVSWNRVRVLGLALGPLGAPSFWPFRDPGPFGKQTKDPSTT